MIKTEATLREELVEIGQKLYERGLVAATEGNISARLSEELFLITPSGQNVGEIEPEDLVKMNLQGDPLEPGQHPSSERRVHLEIYRRRPDVQATVHAHPRYCTGWAIARQELPWQAHPEVVVVLGKVGLVNYIRPSTRELGQAAAEMLRESNACLLANHGAVTVGGSLQEGYQRMEILESFAHSSFVASLINSPKRLSAGEMVELLNI